MEERRKLTRVHLIHYLTVWDRNTNKLIGNLVDITPEGIMIVCEQPIDPGTMVHLRMNFPEEILAAQYLEFDALVMWSRVDINPDMFALGLRLNEVSLEHVKVIYQLIEEYRD